MGFCGAVMNIEICKKCMTENPYWAIILCDDNEIKPSFCYLLFSHQHPCGYSPYSNMQISLCPRLNCFSLEDRDSWLFKQAKYEYTLFGLKILHCVTIDSLLAIDLVNRSTPSRDCKFFVEHTVYCVNGNETKGIIGGCNEY